jgi:hypothetical protein
MSLLMVQNFPFGSQDFLRIGGSIILANRRIIWLNTKVTTENHILFRRIMRLINVVGVEVNSGLLVWCSRTYPGSKHDLTILQEGGILHHLHQDEILMADKGYRGEPKILTPWDLPNDSLTHRQFNSIRIRVEHTLAQIKKFHVLSNRWRHSLHYHPLVWSACAKITRKMQIQNLF